ncbi:hypothetical protein WJX84_009798, partial [Apatococcus fuscideae]
DPPPYDARRLPPPYAEEELRRRRFDHERPEAFVGMMPDGFPPYPRTVPGDMHGRDLQHLPPPLPPRGHLHDEVGPFFDRAPPPGAMDHRRYRSPSPPPHLRGRHGLNPSWGPPSDLPPHARVVRYHHGPAWPSRPPSPGPHAIPRGFDPGRRPSNPLDHGLAPLHRFDPPRGSARQYPSPPRDFASRPSSGPEPHAARGRRPLSPSPPRRSQHLPHDAPTARYHAADGYGHRDRDWQLHNPGPGPASLRHGSASLPYRPQRDSSPSRMPLAADRLHMGGRMLPGGHYRGISPSRSRDYQEPLPGLSPRGFGAGGLAPLRHTERWEAANAGPSFRDNSRVSPHRVDSFSDPRLMPAAREKPADLKLPESGERPAARRSPPALKRDRSPVRDSRGQEGSLYEAKRSKTEPKKPDPKQLNQGMAGADLSRSSRDDHRGAARHQPDRRVDPKPADVRAPDNENGPSSAADGSQRLPAKAVSKPDEKPQSRAHGDSGPREGNRASTVPNGISAHRAGSPTRQSSRASAKISGPAAERSSKPANGRAKEEDGKEVRQVSGSGAGSAGRTDARNGKRAHSPARAAGTGKSVKDDMKKPRTEGSEQERDSSKGKEPPSKARALQQRKLQPADRHRPGEKPSRGSAKDGNQPPAARMQPGRHDKSNGPGPHSGSGSARDGAGVPSRDALTAAPEPGIEGSHMEQQEARSSGRAGSNGWAADPDLQGAQAEVRPAGGMDASLVPLLVDPTPGWDARQEWSYMDPDGDSHGLFTIKQIRQWLSSMARKPDLRQQFEDFKELTRLQARTERRLAAALSYSKEAKHKLAAQERQLVNARRSNEKLTQDRDALEAQTCSDRAIIRKLEARLAATSSLADLQNRCSDYKHKMKDLCSEAEEIKQASLMAENAAAAHREEAATLRQALDIRAPQREAASLIKARQQTEATIASLTEELQHARGMERDMQQAVQDSRRQETLQRDAAEGAAQRERAALQRCELVAEERDQLNSQMDLDHQQALRREQQLKEEHESDRSEMESQLRSMENDVHVVRAQLHQCQGCLTEEQKRADNAAQVAKQHLADAKSELQEAWQRCDSQQDHSQQLEADIGRLERDIEGLQESRRMVQEDKANSQRLHQAAEVRGRDLEDQGFELKECSDGFIVNFYICMMVLYPCRVAC